MTIVKHRRCRDEALVPVARPRGVAPAPLAGRPGIAADVLRELRADDDSLPPTALRAAFDRPAGTWLPAVGLRAVPMHRVVVDDIDTVLADIAAIYTAHPDAGDRLLDRPGALDALAEIRTLLGGAL